MVDFSYPLYKIGANARASRVRSVPLKTTQRPSQSSGSDFAEWSSSDIITPEQITGGIDPETGLVVEGTRQRQVSDATRLLNNPRVTDEGDRSFLESITGAAGNAVGALAGGYLQGMDQVEQWIPGKQWKPSTTTMSIMEGLGRAGTVMNMIYQDVMPNFAKGSLSNMNEIVNLFVEGGDEQAIKDWGEWATSTNTQLLEKSGRSETGDLGAQDYLDVLRGQRAKVEERLGLSDLGAGSFNAATSTIDRDHVFWSNPVMANWLSGERLITGAGTDIVLDPLTYVTGGTAGIGAKATLPIVTGALERTTLKVARDLVEGGVAKMAKELAEQSYAAAKYADDPLARRLATELTPKVQRLIGDPSLKHITTVEEALGELINLQTKRTIGLGDGARVIDLDPAKWTVGAAAGTNTTNVFQSMVDEIAGEIQNKSFGRYVDDTSWWRTFEDGVRAQSDVAMKPWMLGGLRISNPVISPRMANKAIAIPGTQGMKRAITKPVRNLIRGTEVGTKADDWARTRLTRLFNKNSAELTEAARLGASNPARGSYSKVVAARAEHEWAVTAAGLDVALQTIEAADNNVKTLFAEKLGKKEGAKLFDTYLEVMSDGEFNKLAGKIDDETMAAVRTAYDVQRKAYNTMQTEYLRWDPDMADFLRHANYQPMIKTRQAQKWLDNFTKTPDYASRVPELNDPDRFAEFAQAVQNSVKHGGPEITEEHIWIFRQLIDQHTGQVAHLAPQATPSHQQFRKLGRNYVHVIKDDGSSAMRTELTDIAELDQAMNAIVNYINTSRKIPTKWKTGTTTPRTGLKRYQYNIDGFFELDPTIRMTEYVTDIHVGISTRAQAVMGFKYGFIVKNGKYIKPGLVKELYDINTAHVPLDNFLLNRVKQMEAQEIEILLAKASTVTHTVAGRQFRYPVDMASEHMIQVLDNLDLIFRGLEEQAPGLQRRFNSAVIRIKQQNPDFTIEEARSAALRTALPSLYEAQETFLLGLSEEVAAYASGLQDWFSVVGAGELEAAMHSRVITGARADKLLREYNRLEREIIQDAIGAGEIVQGRTLAGRELENLATEMQISQAAKIKAAKNEVSALRAAHAAQVNATDPLGHEAQRLAAELNTATEALRILEEGPRKVVKARRVYTSNEHYAPPGVAEALGVRHEIWDAGSKTQGTALNMVKQSDATILFWHPSWSSQTPGQAKLDLNWFVERITTGEVPERVMTSYDDMWDFFNANFTPIGNGVYVSRPHTKNKIVVVAAFDTIDGAPTSMAAAQRALGDADTISVVGWPEVLDTGGSRRVVDTDIFWSDTAEHKATLAFEELQPAAPTDLADRLTKLKERAAKGRMTPAELESLERIEQAYIRAKNRAADHNVDGYLVEDVAKALFIPVEDFIAMNREVIRPLPGASNRRFQLEMLRGEHGRIATPVVDDDNVRKIAYQAVPRDTVIPPIPDAPLAPKSIQEAFHSLRESVDILTDEEKAILIDATKGYQASVEGGPVANNLLTPRQRAILELDSENTITFGETVRRMDEIVERRQALRTAQMGPLPLDEVPAWVSAMTPYASIDAGQLDAAWQHMNIAVFEGLDPIDSIEDLIWVLQQHWPPAMDDGMLTKSELRTIAQDWIEVKYHDPDLDAAGRRLIAELDDEVGASMSNETIEKIDLLSGEMRETRQMMSKQGIGASGRRGIREKAEDQLLAFENRFESRHGGIDTPVEFRTHHLERTADEALEVTVGTRGKLSRQGITSEKVYDAPFLEWYLPRGVEVRVPQRMKYQPRQFKATKQTKTPTVRTLQTEDAKATVSGGGEPGQRGWGDVELRNQPSHIPGELDDPGASLLPDEIPEAQYNAPKAQEVMGFPDQYQAIGDYGEFVETTMRTLFDEDMSFNDSLIGAAYDAIRPDFDTKIAQINELLNADPTYRRWLREHGIDQRMAQDVVDSYRATRDVGSLMSGGHALMFEKLVALADARAGIELTPGAATVNRLIHIDNSQFAEMTSKQLGETLKSLGIAGRSKARTKTQRLALLDEVFFGGQPERVETAYLKTPLGDRMANTATLPDGSKLVQIHLGSIIEDYQAGLPYLRGTSELAMATGGRAADALYSIGVEVDDLLAWFEHNGGEWAYADFIRNHEYVHAVDPQNLELTDLMAKEMHANVVALRTIGYPVDDAIASTTAATRSLPANRQGFYEVSTAAGKNGVVGDPRFSAFNARIKSRGNRTIEDVYQMDWKGYESAQAGKGQYEMLEGGLGYGKTVEEGKEFYDNLWREFADENPQLMDELEGIAMETNLRDSFATSGANNQAESLERIINERLAVVPPAKVISGMAEGPDTWMLEVADSMDIPLGGTYSPSTAKQQSIDLYDGRLKQHNVVEGQPGVTSKKQAVGKELAERTQMNVDDADVTIAYLPPGIGEKSVGTTKTIRYAMDGVWDKRVSGDLEQVAPYLWRVVNPNGSPTHRTAYVISGPLEDAGVKILAQEVRGRVLNGAGPRPKILKNVAENEAIFKDSMRRVFSESRNESDGFVVPKLVEAPSKVKPAVSVIGTKNATRNAINVGRETSGGVDGGMFGNRYVVTQRQPNGSLIPAVPDTPHPIFTITETVAPRQAAEPQPGLIIPRATGTTSAREVPAPYVAIELRADATRAERLAANRQAVQGYTDDLDRALAANPEFANRVRELAGAELMCPGSHDGMCHSRVLADRVNRINNIADPIREFEAEHARITELNIDRKAKGKPLLDLPKREDFGGRQPQISSQELQDRISMVRNATSIKGKAVSDMVTRFDNVLQAARMNPEQLVATIEQLNRLSSSFNQPDFARLWADRGPALREAVAGLKPGLELQIQWVTDPASGLRSGVLRVVAPGDEAVLFAGKRSDITNMVDDIVAGQLSREDAIARGYGKAVLAADIKQELLDSVGAVADFMQARIGTRQAKYYPAKQLIGEFDVLVKMLNIATSTGRTKGLRSFLGTFAEDGTLTSSVAWRNIQRQVDLMDAARGDQLRWWVETALAADAWDDLAKYHAWHERQMQYTYSAGYTQKTILDALQKEITRSIDEALYFGRDEVARATKTNKEIFAALLGLEDNARASGYQPLDSAGNKFTQTVAGYGKSTPSAHPPKGYRLTSQQHLVNVLRAAEDAKRELQTSGAKEIVPEGFRDNMDLLDQYIEGLRKTLQAIDKEGVSVGNPPGYLPASDFGFQDTIFTDTFMDPLYAETLSMTKKNARLLFTPYGMAEVSQSMNTMVSLWKRWATVVNPAFHARNMVGGVANGWMIGVKPYHYIKWGPMALKWRRGMQRVGQGNLTAEELEDVLHRVILRDIPVEYHQMFEDAMTTRTLGSSFARAEALAPTSAQLSINPFNPDFLVYQAGGRVMEGMEDVMRLTAFATHYDKGAESAAALVKMVHFDYSDLTPMEQKIKDFIPFYVWSRNNIPLQFRMLLESPGYFRKYEILRSTWNQETLSREDDPNRKAWGTYLAAGEGWLTPWRRGSDEDWAWKMINPQLPFSDLAELPIWDEGRFGYDANPIGSLGIGRTTSYLWDLVGPQYNTFSDITPELDSLDRNAPRGFNGILRALDAIGLPGAKVSRDGDAAWADSINQAINKVAPFWHNWSAASGARASNPYRAADEGWLDGDAPAWWEPMRWGLGLDRFVGRGIGSKWETPKNVYFEQKQVDAIIERITRDARLGY